MKTTFVVVCVLIISTFAAMAQPASRRPALPRNLEVYVDEYPDKLMRVTAVKSRLKTLLGKRYTDFDTSLSVQHLITKDGDFLIASGCMPHACTINEAAFVIDLKNKRIHAVVYEKGTATKYFNEDKAPAPQIMRAWVKELDAAN